MKKVYLPLLVMLTVATAGISFACVRSEQAEQQPVTETSQPTPSTSATNDFPHQQLTLPDVEAGSEFDQFRSRLRQAIRDRDIEFVKALIPPDGIGLGFGGPISKQALDDINTAPGAIVWNALEHAIAISCQEDAQHDYPNVDANTAVYTCPNTTAEFYRQYPAPEDAQGVSYEISRVIVIGENISVYERPDSTSPTIATLSNEVVEFDRETWEQIPIEERAAQVDSLEGWTPIILPNNKAGYVSNRYAYSPLGYRAVFGKVNDEWRLLYMPGGD